MGGAWRQGYVSKYQITPCCLFHAAWQSRNTSTEGWSKSYITITKVTNKTLLVTPSLALHPHSQERSWGIAYCVQPHNVPNVLAYLDHREKAGYSTKRLTFHPSTAFEQPFTVLVYIATDSNPEYLGPAPMDVLATQVIESRGPSGCNLQYFFELMQATRETTTEVHDEHLVDLKAAIRRKLKGKHKEWQHPPVRGLPECVCRKYIQGLCSG